MAIRIGKATNTTPESWLNMQTKLDLWEAEQEKLDVIAFSVKPRNSDNIKNDKHAAV
jgi:antitoxin HigA-1